MKIEDVIETMKFTTEKFDIEDEKQVELMKKLIVASAGVLNQIFPQFMKKPLNQDHEFVQFVDQGMKLQQKFYENIETVINVSEKIQSEYETFQENKYLRENNIFPKKNLQ